MKDKIFGRGKIKEMRGPGFGILMKKLFKSLDACGW